MRTLKNLFLLICLLAIQFIISCEDHNDTLRNGLMLHYDFNDNLLDESGNGNNAVASGGNFNLELNGNKSYYFDGISDYLKVRDDPTLNPLNGITISLWFRPVEYYGIGNDAIVVKPFSSHNYPYYQYLIGISGSKNSYYSFGLSLCINNEYKIIGTKLNFWKAGSWYHLVGMYDGRTMKMYVNGILESSLQAEGKLSAFNTDLFIAKQPNLEVVTPGSIDELRIYDRALSQKEVIKIYQESF